MKVERARQTGPVPSAQLLAQTVRNGPAKRLLSTVAEAETSLRNLNSLTGQARCAGIMALKTHLEELSNVFRVRDDADPSATIIMAQVACDSLFFTAVLAGFGGPGTRHIERARKSEADFLQQLRYRAIILLLQAVGSVRFLAERLAHQTPCVITTVLSTLFDDVCFDPASNLVDELFCARKNAFELASVPFLEDLIAHSSPRKLASLCHVLAHAVTEVPNPAGESSRIIPCDRLLKQRRRRSRDSFNATLDRNHAVLVSSPVFVDRIVKLVSLRTVGAKDCFLLDVNGVTFSTGPSGEAIVTVDITTVGNGLSEVDAAALRAKLEEALGRIANNPLDHESHFASWESLDRVLSNRSHVPHTESENGPIYMRDIVMALHQVEVLFMLFSLLGGRRRLDVYKKMEVAGAISSLHRLCKQLDWAGKHVCASQNCGDCECNTEGALKMHFLRILHFLCDRVDDGDLRRKRLLLSDSERKILEDADNGNREGLERICRPKLKKRGRRSGVPFAWGDSEDQSSHSSSKDEGLERFSTHRSLSVSLTNLNISFIASALENDKRRAVESKDTRGIMSPRKISFGSFGNGSGQKPVEVVEKGLLSELITIMRTTREAITRACCAGAIESYLRGSAPSDQEFAARSGLLGALLHGIADGSNGDDSMLQTHFDLLGELIKFNRTVFLMMTEEFKRDGKLFDEALKVTTSNLVDSNVFIRSLLVSLEHFKTQDNMAAAEENVDHVAYSFETCPITSFLSRNATLLLYNLCTVVKARSIDHENICCLNTSLVFFILANAHGEMDSLCMALKELDKKEAVRADVSMVVNFNALLKFWNQYYSHRGVDALSLAVNSGIDFSRWKLVVDKVQDAFRFKENDP